MQNGLGGLQIVLTSYFSKLFPKFVDHCSLIVVSSLLVKQLEFQDACVWSKMKCVKIITLYLITTINPQDLMDSHKIKK